MSNLALGLSLLLLVVALGLLFAYLVIWRDKWIRERPFPSKWLQIVQAGLPVYDSLTTQEKEKLQQLIQLFIAKKRFVGCAGQEIDERVKVTIAAEACLLVLHQGWTVYPKLYSILVYPSAFKAKREEQREDGTVAMAGHQLLGESWSNGKVILSWDDVLAGASDFSDGRNVVLHEFAHQLDSESGSTNGAPLLRHNSYKSWAKVCAENFDDLRWRAMHKHKIVMDEYGATNPAEFFAVATETFFEKPEQLFKKRPELYEELQQYYQVDPRRWQS